MNLLALATALIVSMIRRNIHLRPVQIYLFSTLFFYIVAIFPSHTPEGGKLFDRIFNLSILFDITILYYYFQTLITQIRLKTWLLISYLIFMSMTFYFWLGPMHTFQKFWGTLYGLENLFITIPCIFYFYQIFRSEEIIDYKSNSHFFVMCGVFFFYGTTFPFYVSYKIMYEVTPELYSVLLTVNNILSAILFSTIIKAYLCPLPKEK